MAVPKKRTGHSAQGHRRSNWKASKPVTVKCPNCGETVIAHTVCTACGTYKGQPVSLKDRKEGAVEQKKSKAEKSALDAEAKPKKTTAKKTAKKSEKVSEEVKAEESSVETEEKSAE